MTRLITMFRLSGVGVPVVQGHSWILRRVLVAVSVFWTYSWYP